METEIQQLRKRIEDLEDKLNHIDDIFFRQHLIDRDIFKNPVYFQSKVSFFKSNAVGQQAAITAPTGGATTDAEARTAINSIRTVLSNFGLTL